MKMKKHGFVIMFLLTVNSHAFSEYDVLIPVGVEIGLGDNGLYAGLAADIVLFEGFDSGSFGFFSNALVSFSDTRIGIGAKILFPINNSILFLGDDLGLVFVIDDQSGIAFSNKLYLSLMFIANPYITFIVRDSRIAFSGGVSFQMPLGTF